MLIALFLNGYTGFRKLAKKILIALPPALLEQCDYIASAEHRTRSDFVREALRRYCDNFRRNNAPPIAMMPMPAPFNPPAIALVEPSLADLT